MRISSFALLCLLAMLAWARPAQAAQSYDNCTGFITSIPAVISTQGTWCLKQDLATAITSGQAINITTNNVTLDCNDFKVGGLLGGAATLADGIAASNRTNTTVRHCKILGFAHGIFASGSGAIIEDNLFDLNTIDALDITGDGSVIRRNVVNDTGGSPGVTQITGIYSVGTVVVEDNVVTNVLGATGANATLYGIRVVGGTGAVVSRNAVRGLASSGTGSVNGIYTSNGTQVFLTDNRVSASTVTGQGFRCNSQNGSLKDNVSWGFSDPLDSGACLDDGGNTGR